MFNIRSLFARAARLMASVAPLTPARNGAAAYHAASARVPYPRPSRSKYMPHQGKRERLRRRIHGFAGVANMASDLGITRADALGCIDEFYSASA